MFRKLFTSKFAFWLTYLFSRILNWFANLNGQFSNKPKQVFHIFHARDVLRRLVYSMDTLGFGPIAIHTNWMRTAEYVQTKMDKGQIPQTDCDEYAIYACAILKSTYNVYNPRVLTIRWEVNGKLMGHNTCIFEYKDAKGCWKYGTLCNWELNKGFLTVRGAANYFATQYKGKLLAYCEVTDKLKIIKYAKAS